MNGGQKGRDGREGQAAPAFPALLWCLFFLTAFLFLRTLGERTRPDAMPLECGHVAVDMTEMERCLTIRPGDVELMAELGRVYEQAGQWDRAEGVYRQALAVDVDDGDIRVRLGLVLLRRGEAPGARREAEIAVALQPGRMGPRVLLQAAIGQQPGAHR
jgi:tetratricopeptide (TPR) repeat protein